MLDPIELFWLCVCCEENVVFSVDVPQDCSNCGSPEFENCAAMGDAWSAAEDE